MITKPMLKPMRGYVEVEVNGRRVYRNVKTGEIVEPEYALDSETKEQREFEERFRKTDEYALLDYVLMMEGVK